MLTKTQVEGWLGRSLTDTENAGFDKYLALAVDKFEQLTCSTLKKVTETRIFDSRDGFRSLFVGLFTTLSEVKVDGVIVTNFSPAQGDKRGSLTWYNAVLSDNKMVAGQNIAITANWGFETLPDDVAMTVAQLFALVSSGSEEYRIKSKKIEDFSITYTDTETAFNAFISDFGGILNKYSVCGVGEVRHGRVSCIPRD